MTRKSLSSKCKSIPMKRAAKPEDIACVAVFLASEQVRYIDGTTIVVDGALMLFQGHLQKTSEAIVCVGGS
jgi:glucose 1-dehydrogenase